MRDNVDIIKNMFTKKYSWEQVISVLAEYEQKDNSKELVKLMKEHQPAYYFDGIFGEEVAKFKLVKDLKAFYEVK